MRKNTLKTLIKINKYSIILFMILIISIILSTYNTYKTELEIISYNKNTFIILKFVFSEEPKAEAGNVRPARPIIDPKKSDYYLTEKLINFLTEQNYNIDNIYIVYTGRIIINNNKLFSNIIVPFYSNINKFIIIDLYDRLSIDNSQYLIVELNYINDNKLNSVKFYINDNYDIYSSNIFISKNKIKTVGAVLVNLLYGNSIILNNTVSFDILSTYELSNGLILLVLNGTVAYDDVLPLLSEFSLDNNVSIVFDIIDYNEYRNLVMERVMALGLLQHAALVSVLMVPAAIGLGLAAGGATRELVSAGLILDSRGGWRWVVWAPLVVAPVGAVVVAWVLSLLVPWLRGLVWGVLLVSLVYLGVIGVERLAGRLRGGLRGFGGVVGAIMVVGSFFLYRSGLAAVVGLYASSIASRMLGVTGEESLSSLVGLAYFLVTSRLVLAILGVYGAYLVVRPLLPVVSRGFSNGAMKGIAAMALLASVIAPLVAPAFLALSAGLEATYGGNIAYTVEPGIPGSAYREMVSEPGVLAVAPIWKVGEAVGGIGSLQLVISVGCYDDSLIEYMREARLHSFSAFIMYSFLSEKPVVINTELELGEFRELRIGDTRVNLEEARRPPAGLHLKGPDILVPCDMLPEDLRESAVVTDIIAIANPSVVREWNATVRRYEPDALVVAYDSVNAGLEFIERGASATLATTLLLALAGLAGLLLIFRRIRRERDIEAALLLAGSRGFSRAARALLPAGVALAGLVAITLFVVWIVLLPARLGYPLLGRGWYVVEMLSFLAVAFSPALLFAAYAWRVVRGE